MSKNSKKRLERSRRKHAKRRRERPSKAHHNTGSIIQKLGTAGMQAYARMAAYDPRFKIYYVIPHAIQDLKEASPLGWFTPGLHAAAGPIILASLLPADIREPFSAQKDVLLQRQLRYIWKFVLPLQVDALSEAASNLPSPFQVYITDDEVSAEAIERLRTKTTFPCLHISSIPGANRESMETFCTDKLLKYVEQVIETLSNGGDPNWANFAKQAREAMPESNRRKEQRHSLAKGGHNTVMPNEVALSSFGWELTSIDPVVKPEKGYQFNSEYYVERICNSADAVSKARDDLLLNIRIPKTDYRYIIAVHGVYWGHYAHWKNRIEKIRKTKNQLLRHWFRAAIHATTYFDEIDIAGTNNSIIEEYKVLNASRAADLRSFSAGLSYLSAASLAPVLRLEPRLNGVRGEIKLLANCVRSGVKHRANWKQSRLANVLSEKIRSLINPRFLERIDEINNTASIDGIKLITDLPLEWMLIRGAPLSMQFDASRISVVPGNMFIATCLTLPAIIPYRMFEEVLVIRSFEDGDPLKNLLQHVITAQNENLKVSRCNVRFIDVSNEDEFVAALDGYEGACMIFDGHGKYSDDVGSGSIIIGGNEIDAWQLRKRVTIPPIVMFSACDTHPLDGSHSSTAMGALTLGAQTVLATSLPIEGGNAAVFIGRLILRIAEFIPVALKIQSIVTWREVVSGLLRMMHVTEIMLLLAAHAGLKLDHADFDAIQLEANKAINSRRSDWYSHFVETYAKRMRKTTAEIEQLIRTWAGLTESMKYIQLGAPENIVIVPDDDAAVFSRAAANIQAK